MGFSGPPAVEYVICWQHGSTMGWAQARALPRRTSAKNAKAILMKYILAVAGEGNLLLQKIDLPIEGIVHVRSSVREAARLVLEAIPDVVVIEDSLPDGSGIRVVETLRSHDSLRGVPVVVLGADATSRYERLECHHFLSANPPARDLNWVLWSILTADHTSELPTPPTGNGWSNSKVLSGRSRLLTFPE